MSLYTGNLGARNDFYHQEHQEGTEITELCALGVPFVFVVIFLCQLNPFPQQLPRFRRNQALLAAARSHLRQTITEIIRYRL
jgi:hypothetical protein